jgi:hypothetical protein
MKKEIKKNIEIFRFTLQSHYTEMLSVVMEECKTVDESGEKYFPSLNIEKYDCVKYHPFTSVSQQFYLHYDEKEEEEEEENEEEEEEENEENEENEEEEEEEEE